VSGIVLFPECEAGCTTRVLTVETYVRKKYYEKCYGKFSSQFSSVSVGSKATI
jgi:hypothetical protein